MLTLWTLRLLGAGGLAVLGWRLGAVVLEIAAGETRFLPWGLVLTVAGVPLGAFLAPFLTIKPWRKAAEIIDSISGVHPFIRHHRTAGGVDRGIPDIYSPIHVGRLVWLGRPHLGEPVFGVMRPPAGDQPSGGHEGAVPRLGKFFPRLGGHPQWKHFG